MAKRGTFYLGRIHKIGSLTNKQIIDALKNPVPTELGKYSWTFTGFKSELDHAGHGYVYAKLSKFRPKGTVKIVDTKRHAEMERPEPDLLAASSPFVFLPEYSGIAYLHVWNEIQQKAFVQKFTELVSAKYDHFFVGCQIEAISDMRAFAKKISNLKSISELSATVNPPNPLFGRFWAPLKKYVEERKAAEIKIQEKAAENHALATGIRELISAMSRVEAGTLPELPKESAAIGDQAILMAADGYGRGKVIGERDGQTIVIKTSETIKSFLFEKDPEAADLYKQAAQVFEKLNDDHDMKHG